MCDNRTCGSSATRLCAPCTDRVSRNLRLLPALYGDFEQSLVARPRRELERVRQHGVRDAWRAEWPAGPGQLRRRSRRGSSGMAAPAAHGARGVAWRRRRLPHVVLRADGRPVSSDIANRNVPRLVPTELAALAAGVTVATIRKWASRGKLTRHGRPTRAEYDLNEILGLLAEQSAASDSHQAPGRDEDDSSADWQRDHH